MKIMILFLKIWLIIIVFCAFERINIVGDSISAGINPEVGFEHAHGWVQMFYGEIGEYKTVEELFPGIEKYNHAISGSRASDWADPEYPGMSQLIATNPDLVIVFIGGNDFLEYIADGDFSDSEQAAFREDLETVLDILSDLPSQPAIVLVNYYDLLDGVSENLPAQFAIYRNLSSAVITGNQILSQVAEERNLYYIDTIYSRFMHHCYGRDFGAVTIYEPPYVHTPFFPNFDIHPVTAGHEAIYEEIFSFLENMAMLYTNAHYWRLFQ